MPGGRGIDPTPLPEIYLKQSGIFDGCIA